MQHILASYSEPSLRHAYKVHYIPHSHCVMHYQCVISLYVESYLHTNMSSPLRNLSYKEYYLCLFVSSGLLIQQQHT